MQTDDCAQLKNSCGPMGCPCQGQTGRLAEVQIGRQAGGVVGRRRHTGRQASMQPAGQPGKDGLRATRHAGSQAGRQAARQPGSQAARQPGSQAARKSCGRAAGQSAARGGARLVSRAAKPAAVSDSLQRIESTISAFMYGFYWLYLFVSSETLKCRLLKLLSDHPMKHACTAPACRLCIDRTNGYRCVCEDGSIVVVVCI